MTSSSTTLAAAAPARTAGKDAAARLQERTARIARRTATEIEAMRAAGQVVRAALNAMIEACRPGVCTQTLDEIGDAVIRDAGGESLFRWYPTYRVGEGFPGAACISVNDEIVHGVPGDRQIREGDVVTFDCGVRLDGWCGDAASTILVGSVDPEHRRLVDVSRAILDRAIESIEPGRRWSAIAGVMERMAREAGFGVVTEYVGHGVGRKLHEPPQIPAFVGKNFLDEGDFILEPGMVLAIEPMLTCGRPSTRTGSDGWTVLTRDGRVACHVEHTVAVVANGADVLTADGSSDGGRA